MPTLNLLIEGRPDLAGPLAQLGLGRDGTFYVVAAGLCNHAGDGAYRGIVAGNTHLIGIEAENTGLAGDSWPQVQLQAYQHAGAAILRHIGRGSDFCVGHKEWAPQRKNDPSLDMVAFRAGVGAILSGRTPVPTPIPVAEPVAAAGQPLARPTVRRAVPLGQSNSTSKYFCGAALLAITRLANSPIRPLRSGSASLSPK